ncbi:permease transmembrane protein [Nitzschia inconspicua]|uniref:Permease transmembrane protein n=1 Tax=Nitzschia inconspicua TaxID=303405 RepID=A0A9K3KGR8_9STRA|nr:permease transmembrane protein [Nitzschia inconspicua]
MSEEIKRKDPAPSTAEGGNWLTKELSMFWNGISMTGGDYGSLCQLFFDNLSTLLGALFALQTLANPIAFGDIAVSTDTMNQIVWGQIVPGVGVTMVAGNLYYTWQAIRMTNKYGRQYTAQPYGLNTPGAFAFVYNIIYSIFFAEGGGDEAFIKGYKVALAANFVTGLISLVLGVFGRYILKVVPPAGLLVPIAGIGVAFLGLEQLTNSIAAPIVGYSTIMWVYLGWYANIRLGYGSFRLPEALQVILIGIILGWATGLNDPQDTKDAAKLVKWWGPVWTGGDIFEDIDLLADYLGIVIPLGISAAATSLMCLVSAKEAGDPFPVRESMIADGIGTCVASFFGSPFGTVIYIGHPAHKRSGAKIGYSMVNGIVYLFFSWFGLLALIQSIVNPATIGPIVFFVGLQVNEEALNFMPSRHYSAYIIGIFPSVYDWVTNVSNLAPVANEDFSYDVNSAGFTSWFGVLAWKRGSLLVSLLWVSMIVNVLDRQWKGAAIWAFIASLFAVFGIIHVPQAGFSNFSDPFWEQCSSPDFCWEYANQWMFFVAYLMLAVTFLLVLVGSKYDDHIEEPIDDESRHAFDDWFADAYKYKDEDGNICDSRHEVAIVAPGSAANEFKKDPDHDPNVEKEESPASVESVSEET